MSKLVKSDSNPQIKYGFDWWYILKCVCQVLDRNVTVRGMRKYWMAMMALILTLLWYH